MSFWNKIFKRKNKMTDDLRSLGLLPPPAPKLKLKIIEENNVECDCHKWKRIEWNEKYGKETGMTKLGPIERVGSMYVWSKSAFRCELCDRVGIEESGFLD